nr:MULTISPECIES: potassium-transporting ATPase subunit F [Frigoribacterium]
MVYLVWALVQPERF